MGTLTGRIRELFRNYSLATFVIFIVLSIFIQSCSSKSNLSEGDEAPQFTLTSSAGREVSLNDAIADGPVLLYFHMAGG